MIANWISVDERLPDDDLTVMIYLTSDRVWLGYHDDDEWYTVDGFRSRPTHWCDIPDGPIVK